VTMGITAGVFAVAAFATFALLKERAVPRAGVSEELGLRASWQRLQRTWREADRFVDFRWLLTCAVAYQAGIAVVIALAAVYAEQVLGFSQTDTMMLVFLVNIASALGAFAWGYVQDWLGHRRALAVTLWGWVLMTGLAVIAKDKPTFWGAAVIAGLCMGSSQSAGRALAGLFAPAGRLAEFFGLWTFAVRLAAIIGPVTYGVVAWATAGNHRVAFLVTGGFFVIGLLLLARVQVQRGIAAAQTAAA
jgi:UMF1 family MFS transporter